jgi:predicted DNA-binding ribbon-helix-helix protein
MRSTTSAIPLPAMVRKRSVVVQDHKTSVSLESPFWESLKEIASLRQTTVADLVNGIENKRQDTEQVTNLSSAIRLFVLDHYRSH